MALFAVRRPKTVLAAAVVLLAIGIVLGGSVSEKLGIAGFTDPSTEAARADDFLDQHFGATPNLVLQVVARNGTLDHPRVAAAADEARKAVEAEHSAKVIASYTDSSATDLRSRDDRSGLILVHAAGTADEAAHTASRIIKALPGDDADVSVRAGGTLGVQRETEERVNHDLALSESIALPVSLVVLIIVFGGVVAALLPVAIGVTSIVLTMLVLLALTTVTDVSIHALTVATAFGLGLSIDFGLLMVSRFREERAKGNEHEAAIIATVTTAGRTIVFSAATVTAAMTGLLVFPVYFVRSVGLAAIAVVILAALSAVVLLPALLALLGSRIDALRVIRRKTQVSADSAFWRRCAEAVIHRPFWFALPVVAALLALGIPFLHVQLATPDERALPADSNARLLTESLRSDYPVDGSQAVTLVAPAGAAALTHLVEPVSRMDGVVRVSPPSAPTASDAGYAFVYLSVDAQSETAQRVVRDIRAMIQDDRVGVGGPTANLIDSRAAIAARLPLAIAIMAGATFLLLFLFTGSVVVPIKALLLNVLVLSAVLGVMVLVFQDGHLASALGVTPAPLNLSMVVLLCCIAFSLSVDYEIFLLSRIKEARDGGLSNDDAIVAGLGRVGRIITSAAVLLTITLLSFANGLSFMKMFGIGTALAIVIDATVIRGVVVPAFLRLAGEFNWWAPAPLRWLHDRIGLSEAPEPEPRTEVLSHPTQPDEKTVPATRTLDRTSHVEVLPGTHVVANLDGIVIVVAHRDGAPLSQGSPAAQQISTLLDTVRRCDRRRLAGALSVLASTTRGMADFAVVVRSDTASDVYLYGAVTVGFDTGATLSELLGTPGRVRTHRSLPLPAVATVVTVDEERRRAPDRTQWTGVFALAAGIVPGRGAVIWTTRPIAARQAPDEDVTARIDRDATIRIGQLPQRRGT
ncbi:MMPL family transporter [Mycobacterium sp. JS623]|uniref:MMPL family transporter n=1 Tax=Mycobacterium sp. JS623 TaxID=212767 RepID=UPI001E4B00D1|nr:MMPL family transporter [Mycobacterium sp. JS623]